MRRFARVLTSLLISILSPFTFQVLASQGWVRLDTQSFITKYSSTFNLSTGGWNEVRVVYTGSANTSGCTLLVEPQWSAYQVTHNSANCQYSAGEIDDAWIASPTSVTITLQSPLTSGSLNIQVFARHKSFLTEANEFANTTSAANATATITQTFGTSPSDPRRVIIKSVTASCSPSGSATLDVGSDVQTTFITNIASSSGIFYPLNLNTGKSSYVVSLTACGAGNTGNLNVIGILR